MRRLFSREIRPFDNSRHLNDGTGLSLSFPRRVPPRLYAGWFSLMRTPHVIILSMCAHRAPTVRDINPRSRYFQCFGQKVPCYPQTSAFIPRVCRCRCIITGFRSGKCTAAFPHPSCDSVSVGRMSHLSVSFRKCSFSRGIHSSYPLNLQSSVLFINQKQ